MALSEHLYELRNRLAKALVGIAIGVVVAFIFFRPVFHVLAKPYCDLPLARRDNNTCNLVFFGPLDGFLVRFKVAMIGGVLFSAPVWLYQLWSFITPGLHRNERRYALSFVAASLVLFASGASVAYLSLSQGLEFLLKIAGGNVTPFLEVTRYLGFVTLMLVVFGAAFEFPLLLVGLNLAGVLSADRLRRWRRGMYFVLFAFAAVATPAQDPFTMLFLAVPLCLFYEGCVVFARVHDRRKARRDARLLFTDTPDDEASPFDPGELERDDAPAELEPVAAAQVAPALPAGGWSALPSGTQAGRGGSWGGYDAT